MRYNLDNQIYFARELGFSNSLFSSSIIINIIFLFSVFFFFFHQIEGLSVERKKDSDFLSSIPLDMAIFHGYCRPSLHYTNFRYFDEACSLMESGALSNTLSDRYLTFLYDVKRFFSHSLQFYLTLSLENQPSA